MFVERKVGVTECQRSLNAGNAIAMAICPIIAHVLIGVHSHT